jgi:phage-related protein
MATLRDTYVLEVQTERARTGVINLKNAIGTIAGAVAAAGLVNMARDAVNTFTAFERLTTQIATYTGGIENARTEMARLEQLSFELPQDLNDLAQAFTILTRSGIETTTENIRALSEVAAANGKEMTQLAEAVADGMVGEFERFKEFGIKVSKEGDNLVARVGDQQVAVAQSAAELTTQLIALGEEGGRFAGAAAANADTLTQSFSNLNGAVSIVQRSFVEGLKPGLQSAVNGITNFALNNRELLTSIGELVGSGLSILAPILQLLTPVFQTIGTILRTVVVPVFNLLAQAVSAVVSVLSPIVETVLAPVRAGFELLGVAIQAVVGFFQGVINAVGALLSPLQNLATAISGYFDGIAEKARSMAESVYNSVTGWFGRMYDAVVGNSIIPDMATGVLGVFDNMAAGMISYIQSAVSGVVSTMGNLASSVSGAFSNVASTGLTNLRSMMSSMAQAISSGVNSLASSISSRLTGIVNSVRNTASRAGSVFSNLGFANPLDNFAGFFANGGMIPAGQFGIAGEAGPEVITGPATVTPLSQLGGGMTQVTYNINAVDAASFRSLLARDPSFVHAVVQRGAAGVAGRR